MKFFSFNSDSSSNNSARFLRHSKNAVRGEHEEDGRESPRVFQFVPASQNAVQRHLAGDKPGLCADERLGQLQQEAASHPRGQTKRDILFLNFILLKIWKSPTGRRNIILIFFRENDLFRKFLILFREILIPFLALNRAESDVIFLLFSNSLLNFSPPIRGPSAPVLLDLRQGVAIGAGISEFRSQTSLSWYLFIYIF